MQRSTFVDLFCGGGFGARGAVRGGGVPLLGLDIWQLATDTYKANFPKAEVLTERIEKVDAAKLAKRLRPEILLTSPECTAHSVARGAKPGSEKSRETAIRIVPWIEAMKPRWVIVENVNRMKSWDRHDELVATIDDLGYTVSSLYLNSAEFGSAQARKRLFLVCDKRGTAVTKETLLTISKAPSMSANDIIDWEANFKSEKLRKKGRAAATLERANRAIAALGRRICIGALLSSAELDELNSWLDRRISAGASLEDYLFALPEDKLWRIPNSFFERLNQFLRMHTRYADEGKGIHLHHLRHAAHSWLFYLLICGQDSMPLFPELTETNAWASQRESMTMRLYRHSLKTRKHPFFLARNAGHSSFSVTAGSYIHLFPWALSARLEQSLLLAPRQEEVKKASGEPDATCRRWLVQGDVHNVPFQVFKEGLQEVQPIRHEFEAASTLLTLDRGSEDWLNPVWNELLRRGRNDVGFCMLPDFEEMAERAEYLQKVAGDDGGFRHLMTKDAYGVRLACPLRPPHIKDIVEIDLIRLFGNVHRQNQELLTKASSIFVANLQRSAYLRFDGLEKLDESNCYIGFLRQLGLTKSQIELVSGDPDPNSAHRRDWRANLRETNMLISPADESRNYGAKSALSIRPNFYSSRAVLSTGPAGFRFAMAMTFIVFGKMSTVASIV